MQVWPKKWSTKSLSTCCLKVSGSVETKSATCWNKTRKKIPWCSPQCRTQISEILKFVLLLFSKGLEAKKKVPNKKKNRATHLTEAFVLEQVKFKFLVSGLSMGLGKEDYLNFLFFGQSQSLHFDAEISLRKYEKWKFINSEFFLLTCPSESCDQSGSSLKM